MVARAMILTQSDVESLLKSGSAETRIEVMEKVSDHYVARNLTDREIEIAEQIFRLLMKDAEVMVRSSLAQKLKSNPDIPRDIVLHLSQDKSKVAMPMLEYSPVLSDADLVHVIESSKELAKLQSIARRKTVSGRVSDALVETHYPDVVIDLLQNKGAVIPSSTLEQVSQDFAHEESVLIALSAQTNLPATVIDHLMHHASQNVTKALRTRFGDKLIHSVEKTANTVQEATIMQLLARYKGMEAIKPLVQQMHREGRLNASIIMTALCQGYLNFVRVAVAKLADIPVQNATKLLSDSGDLGVRAIYTRTQMPESMYSAVRLLLYIAHELEAVGLVPGTQAYANAAVERLLTHPQSKEIENLPYIMALMRQQ